jgi:type I restriction enzyme R subunit
MTPVGQPERETQNRVITLFRDGLGYRYLGDWTDRDGNSNVEEGLLSAWLTRRGYTPPQISVVLHKLRTGAGEAIKRTSSGRGLMSQIGQATPRLLM